MGEILSDPNMQWALGGAGLAALLALAAEWLHLLRIRRVADLAFGPGRAPADWTWSTPFVRAVAAALVAWGLLVLWLVVKPRVYSSSNPAEEARHLVLVLDVSPSMQIRDSGPTGEQSRTERAADVLQSLFDRVAIGKYRISVVATYNGAKPVVVDTSDAAVVRNILDDLPMRYAFRPGKTRLFDGLEEAARICEDWKQKTATVVVVSDGDTVPPTGIPQMPPSVSGVLVVGVGDPTTGTQLNGTMSRQDASMLRQMAIRLGGVYHDGNKRHVSTADLKGATAGVRPSPLEQLGLREYALLAVALGSVLLALWPLLLDRFGSRWQPGAGQLARGQGGKHASVPAGAATLRATGGSADSGVQRRA